MSDDKKILIHAVIDMAEVEQIVTDALKIEDAPGLFEHLSKIAQVKKMLADASEQLAKAEADAKGLINAKAKQLYGDNWQAIKGRNFKISRSYTGAKYEHTAAADEAFIVVKTSVDSKAVETFVKENNKLPEGIEVNRARGEMIRITVAEEADNDSGA